MLLRKDRQKVPKGLVFVQIAILSSPGTKILNDFDRIEIYALRFALQNYICVIRTFSLCEQVSAHLIRKNEDRVKIQGIYKVIGK